MKKIPLNALPSLTMLILCICALIWTFFFYPEPKHVFIPPEEEVVLYINGYNSDSVDVDAINAILQTIDTMELDLDEWINFSFVIRNK